MEIKRIQNLAVYYEEEEEEAAGLAVQACRKSLALLDGMWGLAVPGECRVYIMTSWRAFLFHAAPWPWRLWLGLTLPLRRARIEALWKMSGGWAQRYGRRRTIGLKPPRLLGQIDAGLRERLFVARDVEAWFCHNACHELVHAATDHLRLPAWLHEGLAMVTVDGFAGRPTVKAETLDALGRREEAGRGNLDADALLRLAVRGYWISRYLADSEPALLRDLLQARHSQEALETDLAAGLGLSRSAFWETIDGIVLDHYRDR